MAERKPILTYRQAKIILVYAEKDMDAKATGGQLYLSDGSIHYHLGLIREATRLDPKRFYDLCVLVGLAHKIVCECEQSRGEH